MKTNNQKIAKITEEILRKDQELIEQERQIGEDYIDVEKAQEVLKKSMKVYNELQNERVKLILERQSIEDKELPF